MPNLSSLLIPLVASVLGALFVEAAHMLSAKLRADGQAAAASAVDSLAGDVANATGVNAPVVPVIPVYGTSVAVSSPAAAQSPAASDATPTA